MVDRNEKVVRRLDQVVYVALALAGAGSLLFFIFRRFLSRFPTDWF